MKNIFQCLPSDFFKPLTGKYRNEYADCIQLIFNTFKPEISYGVNREIVIAVLEDYFSNDDSEMFFEESLIIAKDARGKANEIVRQLKESGWLEYDQVENHQINLVLYEYAIPIIESFNKIIKDEETEYQGIISQIYSTLLNTELYNKPYELIFKGVYENTERLVSELKKLNASIKRHMENQTNEMGAAQVLEHFFLYHKNIGSKAYLRMKTSENVYYFRSEIIEKLNEIMSSQKIMDAAVKGFMELESVEDGEIAYDSLLQMILEIKSAFNRLNEIIEEIDKKHAKYMRNAVMRAKFLLSTGNNMEGKLLKILSVLVDEMNLQTSINLYENTADDVLEMFRLYPQKYMDSESLKAIPVLKRQGIVDEVGNGIIMTEQEREIYKEALKEKNRNRFTRKNINAYVETLLEKQPRIKASSLELEGKRDVIRLVYISIYGNNKANTYRVERNTQRIKVGDYEIPDFDIVKI